MAEEVLARVRASSPRRGLGVAVLGTLGLTLVYLAFMTPPQGLGYQLLLLVLGAGALRMAFRMWQVSQGAIEVTMRELRLGDGTLLVRTDQIVAIDRGMFALKPSHGFTLRLDAKMPGAWHPGMWWRMGRRIGVGGVTHGAQTRIMADVISAMIAARQPQ